MALLKGLCDSFQEYNNQGREEAEGVKPVSGAFVSIWYKMLISLLSARTLSDSNKAQKAPTSLDSDNTTFGVLRNTLGSPANRYIFGSIA